MSILFWVSLAFLAGSLPFSPLLGRWVLRANIREYGDGNPGSTNVLRAGGWRLGVIAMLLDAFKGAAPVAAAYWGAHLTGWPLALVAVAPLFGHAFSPFLGGRGGKAVATLFGVWAGLTGPEGPLVLGCLLAVWFLAVDNSGWAMVFTLLSFLAHLWHYRPEPHFLLIWLIGFGLIAWKYRQDLRRRPHLRTGLAAQLLRRSDNKS